MADPPPVPLSNPRGAEQEAAAPARRRRWTRRGPARQIKRTAAVVLFLLVFNHLVVPQLGGARRALHLLSQVEPLLLLGALLLEAAAVVAYAQLTRVALPPEPRLKLTTILRVQLATKTVTNLVPGGSAAGSTLGFRLLSEAGVAPSHVGFALATVGLGSAVVLNLLLWAALMVSIPLDGTNAVYGSAAIVGVVLLGLVVAVVALLLKGREPAVRVVRAVARRLPFVDEETAARFVVQLAARLRELLADPSLVRRGAFWALVNWCLDAASLWVFLLAFGGSVNPVELLVAFGLANVLAVIPITPGGLGVVEAVLTSTLVGFGLDRGTAAIGVVTYRLAAFWVPIPLGAATYASLRIGPRSLRRLRLRHELRRIAEETGPDAQVRVWDVAHPDPAARTAGPPRE